jgi:hypothetical protein
MLGIITFSPLESPDPLVIVEAMPQQEAKGDAVIAPMRGGKLMAGRGRLVSDEVSDRVSASACSRMDGRELSKKLGKRRLEGRGKESQEVSRSRKMS